MSREVTQILNHASLALQRLAQQYKDKPKLAALIGVFTPKVQELEDVFWSLHVDRRIELAVGEQLDLLGRVVGQRRDGASDSEYRLRLKARVRANFSTGSPEDIYSVFRILLPTGTMKITEYYPAGITLELHPSIDPALVDLYTDFLDDSRGAAIAAQLLWSSDFDTKMFTFAAAAFLNGLHNIGSTTLTVDSTAGFPDSGSLILDETLSNEELVTYTGKTPTSFTGVSATTASHSNLACASLANADYLTMGYSNDPGQTQGGKLAGVELVS